MNKEFIKMYKAKQKTTKTTDWELKECGFIRKPDINILWASSISNDYYVTQMPNTNETIYVKKTDFEDIEKQDDDPDPRHKKLQADDLDHWKQVFEYQMENLKNNPITKEAIDKALKNNALSDEAEDFFKAFDEFAKNKGVPPEPQTAHPKIATGGETYVWANMNTIKQCIELLSTDGKGTKQQVKERLEELLK